MHVWKRSIVYSAAATSLLAPFLGCSHAVPAIPASATRVNGGQGRLEFVAQDNGEVYLLDADMKLPSFQAKVSRGDAVHVDPSSDRIEVAGKPAGHKPPLNPLHVYRIYFDRAS